MRCVKTFLDKSLEAISAMMLGLLVVTVVWQVMARYLFKVSTPWTEELAMFLMIWLCLLSTCVAYRRQSHLGIDALMIRFSPRTQIVWSMVIHSLVILFAAAVMLGGGIVLVRNTFLTHQFSAAMGVRMGYVYLAAPISGIFLMIDGVEFLIDAFGSLRNPPKTPSDTEPKTEKELGCLAR